MSNVIVFSQINVDPTIDVDSVIKDNFNHKQMSRIVFGFNLFEGITSSYQYEKSLRNKFTYCLTTKISTSFLYSNSDLFGEQFLINFYPIIKNEFRFYTDLKKRLNKNKSIAHFSGSYFGTNINIQFPKLIDNSLGLPYSEGVSLNLVYGSQVINTKNHYANIYCELRLFEITNNKTPLYIPIQLGFNWGWYWPKRTYK